MKTGKSYIIAGMFEGKPFNSPNDITIDEKGRIYFSDPRYLGHEPIDQPVHGRLPHRHRRLDPPHHHRRRQAERRGVSPDQKTLYVVSNDNGTTGIGRHAARTSATPLHKGRMALMAYDLAADGTAKFRKVLVDYAPQDGPDGLVLRQGRQPLRRRPRREPARHLRLFARGQGTRLHQDRNPHQRRLRPRQGSQDALHHGRQEPVSHQAEPRRVSVAGEEVAGDKKRVPG